MKYYHGYWPVLAIIKQYLTNVKKRLTRDLNAEQQDLRLPGSEGGKNQMKANSEKSKTRHRVILDNDSDADTEEDDEEVEPEVSDDGVVEDEPEVDDEDEEVEAEVDDEDNIDEEDDRAEMDLYEHYSEAFEDDTSQRNGIQDDEDESGWEPLPSKKSRPPNKPTVMRPTDLLSLLLTDTFGNKGKEKNYTGTSSQGHNEGRENKVFLSLPLTNVLGNKEERKIRTGASSQVHGRRRANKDCCKINLSVFRQS